MVDAISTASLARSCTACWFQDINSDKTRRDLACKLPELRVNTAFPRRERPRGRDFTLPFGRCLVRMAVYFGFLFLGCPMIDGFPSTVRTCRPRETVPCFASRLRLPEKKNSLCRRQRNFVREPPRARWGYPQLHNAKAGLVIRVSIADRNIRWCLEGPGS